MSIDLGAAVPGELETTGDADHYVFEGRKGQPLRLSADAQRTPFKIVSRASVRPRHHSAIAMEGTVTITPSATAVA